MGVALGLLVVMVPSVTYCLYQRRKRMNRDLELIRIGSLITSDDSASENSS